MMLAEIFHLVEMASFPGERNVILEATVTPVGEVVKCATTSKLVRGGLGFRERVVVYGGGEKFRSVVVGTDWSFCICSSWYLMSLVLLLSSFLSSFLSPRLRVRGPRNSV